MFISHSKNYRKKLYLSWHSRSQTSSKQTLRDKVYKSTAGLLSILMLSALPVSASEEDRSYDKVAPYQEQLPAGTVSQYGMLPIYGRDVADGSYQVEVHSSSSMFRVIDATLTVANGEMEAAITLSGTGYLKLFLGTGEEAARSDISSYIGYEEEEDGHYTYTLPVEALNKEIPCAAFSKRKDRWYDRLILFDASSLPEDALAVTLPDYDTIEKAMRLWERNQANNTDSTGDSIDSENMNNTADSIDSESMNNTADSIDSESTTSSAVEAIEVDMNDGEYSIELTLTGGSGKASVVSPTILTVKDGKAYAQIQWSSSNYDYMLIGKEKYLNMAEPEAYSVFEIPITAMDEPMTVIADTTAMGTPHEVEYTLTFYFDTIGSKSQMPQEAAKRVVAVALLIIIGGGILNHYMKKKRLG